MNGATFSGLCSPTSGLDSQLPFGNKEDPAVHLKSGVRVTAPGALPTASEALHLQLSFLGARRIEQKDDSDFAFRN
jgi:hypothetical protein